MSLLQNPQDAAVEFYLNIDFTTLIKTAKGLNERSKTSNGFDSFLKACGIPEEMLTAFKSWVKTKPTGIKAREDSENFFSCFISYSHKDQLFAKKVQSHLQKKGIQVWFDEEQILPGDDIFDAVDNGIRSWDKILLLCCSKNSLNSPWVDLS